MKRLFWLVLLTIVVTHANAGDWGLQVHVASAHVNQRAGVPWNESNDGFALRYVINDTTSVQASHFRNAQSMPGFNFFTNAVYLDTAPLMSGGWRAGGYVGAESGNDQYTYARSNGKFVVTSVKETGVEAVAGLLGRYQWDRFNVTARFPITQEPALWLEAGFTF